MNKWDKRYLSSTTCGEPCWLLEQFQHLLPASGRALDLACGLGGNAMLLARHDLETHAWDFSSIALRKLQSFATQQQFQIDTDLRDLERQPPPANSFDVIVVSHYLYRPLFPALVAALRPGGLVFYQTWHQQKRSDHGPSNPDYLLAPGELLEQFSALQTVYYREDGRHGSPQEGLRDLSYYVGCKP